MSTEPATDPGVAGPQDGLGRPVVRLSGIVKDYGPARVLHGVDFDVRAGEVHGLLGGNGAGKSTLMKCLAGAEPLTEGGVEVDGEAVELSSPSDGIDAGIAVVYQELSLFPALTVAENLLGARGTGRWVRWKDMEREAAGHLETLGMALDPSLRIEQLAVGQQQMVEIARALFSGAKVVVLDEPTSALSAVEKELLFGFVHEMTARGVAFVLVTHTLEDVFAHCDRVTVLRNGRLVATTPTASITRETIVRQLVGRHVDELAQAYDSEVVLPPRATTPVLLDAKRLEHVPAVRSMSFALHAGEIVGLYGHIGSGHIEVADLLFGLEKPSGGEMSLREGTSVIANPTQAREAGIGFISIDRRDGLALEQSVARNMTLASLHRLQGRWLRPREESRLAGGMIDKLAIAGAEPGKPVGLLSGGNQQKVLFARWLLGRRPEVLVLVEPTRGMDVAAKAAVLDIVRELAGDGTAVLVVSSETETVMAVAHRILVARRGEVVADLSDTAVSEELLMEKAS